jgi:lysophospholipase L1-like esterase
MAVDPGTDLAIVEFGINDRRAGASVAQVRTRIVEIVRALRARGIQVLVVGTGGLDFSELAAANGAAYVAWKLPRHRYRARDGAHFNADGYRILVEHMLPQVEALLGHARGTAN